MCVCIVPIRVSCACADTIIHLGLVRQHGCISIEMNFDLLASCLVSLTISVENLGKIGRSTDHILQHLNGLIVTELIFGHCTRPVLKFMENIVIMHCATVAKGSVS